MTLLFTPPDRAGFLCYIRAAKMPKPIEIRVRSAGGNYRVVCGSGITAGAHEWIVPLRPFTGCYVLTARPVWRAVGKTVGHGLRGKISPRVVLMDDRES